MAALKIPKTVTMMGHTITIKRRRTLVKRKKALGLAHFDANLIELQTPIRGVYDETGIEHALIHELIHFALHYLGHEELNEDEKFVDTLAALIHQALVTATYG